MHAWSCTMYIIRGSILCSDNQIQCMAEISEHNKHLYSIIGKTTPSAYSNSISVRQRRFSPFCFEPNTVGSLSVTFQLQCDDITWFMLLAKHSLYHGISVTLRKYNWVMFQIMLWFTMIERTYIRNIIKVCFNLGISL